MKILVTTTPTSSGKKYLIEVVEGNTTLHSEVAKDIVNRDKIVWGLADLYNTVDIEMKDDKEEDFKFNTIPSIPVLEEEETDEFFEENKELVYTRILQAVEEGIESGRDSIRLFELNGTGVYITSNKADWSEGVSQALEYFLSVEDYDKCVQARQLMSSLQ
jgi:hypothetical protein